MGGVEWQQHREAGTAWPAVSFDAAVVLLDEVLRQRQTQAATAFPAGNEGVEHLLADFVRYAGAIIDDLQFQRQAVALLGNGDLPLRARAQDDLTTPFQHLRGIAGDIQYGLDELLPIPRDAGSVSYTHLTLPTSDLV